jgi:hypothetical protein
VRRIISKEIMVPRVVKSTEVNCDHCGDIITTNPPPMVTYYPDSIGVNFAFELCTPCLKEALEHIRKKRDIMFRVLEERDAINGAANRA